MPTIWMRPLKGFYDEQDNVQRHRGTGLFKVHSHQRAMELEAREVAEVAIRETVEEKSAAKEAPEDKSLSGPSENKSLTEQKMETMTVSTLRNMAEEDFGIDLPAGYIKKEDLIQMIKEVM